MMDEQSQSQAAAAGAEQPDGASQSGDEQLGFEQACLSLMQQAVASQSDFARTLSEVAGQNAFIRQQQGQLYAAVDQLYKAVGAQCQQLLHSDASLQQELQKFQTGGPQRAMAGLFNKLFRELIGHVNELDDIAAGLDEAQKQHPLEAEWLKAIGTARDNLENILKSWGCRPMLVRVGDEEFDPELHHSVEAQPGEIPAATPENIIVKVRRRGWMLNEQILQHPLVVVS